MLNFSVNNRKTGLSNMGTPTFSEAWFLLKQFLVTNGWTVTQSGAHNTTYGDSFGSGDHITASDDGYEGMSSDNIWFVLEDPGGVRQFLFYRNKTITPSTLINASNMLIAYSAESKFSLVNGHGGTAVSATNPPIATDMIWLHLQDTQYSTTLPDSSVNVRWGGSGSDEVTHFDFWNIHICASDTAPYPFYFWFTGKNKSLGFFAMDGISDYHASDNDETAIWFCPENGGISSSWSIQDVQQTGTRIRGWINKQTFSSRNDFETKIDSNYSRFLSLTVPMFNILMYRDTPGEYDNDKQFYSIAPQGLSTNLYDNKDELFPIMYFKFSATPGSNLASMPNVYKGTSSLFKMESVNRYEFDTLTTDTTRDKIVCGTARTVVIPWNGAIFNAV